MQKIDCETIILTNFGYPLGWGRTSKNKIFEWLNRES